MHHTLTHEGITYESNDTEEMQPDGRLRKEVVVSNQKGSFANLQFTFFYHGKDEDELKTDLKKIIEEHHINNLNKA